MARWEQNNVLLRNFQQSNTLMEATCLANGYVLWKDTCWNKISSKVIEYYIRNSNYSQKILNYRHFIFKMPTPQSFPPNLESPFRKQG